MLFWIGMADWIRWKQHEPKTLDEAKEMARAKMRTDHSAKGLPGMEVEIFKVTKSESECSADELAAVKKVPGARTPLRDMSEAECFQVCVGYGVNMSQVVISGPALLELADRRAASKAEAPVRKGKRRASSARA